MRRFRTVATATAFASLTAVGAVVGVPQSAEAAAGYEDTGSAEHARNIHSAHV